MFLKVILSCLFLEWFWNGDESSPGMIQAGAAAVESSHKYHWHTGSCLHIAWCVPWWHHPVVIQQFAYLQTMLPVLFEKDLSSLLSWKALQSFLKGVSWKALSWHFLNPSEENIGTVSTLGLDSPNKLRCQELGSCHTRWGCTLRGNISLSMLRQWTFCKKLHCIYFLHWSLPSTL